MQQGMLFLRQASCLADATCMQGILHAGMLVCTKNAAFCEFAKLR